MSSRLVLALDETDPARALEIAKLVSPFVAKIKINYPLVLSAGLGIVTEISKFCPVICDFKVADIPNTNRLISEAVFEAGASGIT
jgi:orotidine-5'-phosphate decarboxylase